MKLYTKLTLLLVVISACGPLLQAQRAPMISQTMTLTRSHSVQANGSSGGFSFIRPRNLFAVGAICAGVYCLYQWSRDHRRKSVESTSASKNILQRSLEALQTFFFGASSTNDDGVVIDITQSSASSEEIADQNQESQELEILAGKEDKFYPALRPEDRPNRPSPNTFNKINSVYPLLGKHVR